MKKNLSLLVGAALPVFLMIGACGDDTVDAGLRSDEDEDATARDATALPPAPDARTDARADSGSDGDAGTESDGDADLPDVDVPDVDVPDGGTPPAVFVTALQNAYCANYNDCCTGDPSTPAAGPTCLESVQTLGFFSGLLDAYYLNPAVAASAKVRVDEALMASCLANVAALGCVNVENQVPATAWKGVLEDCSGALYGTGVAGDDCLSDIECGKELSCRGIQSDPGGVGTCTALSTLGLAGANTGPTFSDSCSYRGFGEGTNLHVDSTNTCQPLRATGEPCFAGDEFGGFDVNCESRACSFDDEVAPTGLFCSDVKNDLYICVYKLP